MTDIKQIYTSHQSLVGTVTPSVIRTVPFSLGGYAPSGKWYSPYNFGCYSSNQRLALACIFVYYTGMVGRQVPRESAMAVQVVYNTYKTSMYYITCSVQVTKTISCCYTMGVTTGGCIIVMAGSAASLVRVSFQLLVP